MTEAEFHALAAQGYNRIPVTVETFADLDTRLYYGQRGRARKERDNSRHRSTMSPF